ncbi:hypothetical protein LTR70_007322 [Exophiala xenobiotica]|uniref:Uncharacterized protein n=1 Tax=Lithohypha guttulata TaxID=1690604 RepID=A0ABR0K3Z6_9EURO|nr:hypothetical protein LTR24_007092 [Lithohypha guttulata]KAK5314111.1 hypothetical protein LTR70_007322 [Exophiala xenobiotica]
MSGLMSSASRLQDPNMTDLQPPSDDLRMITSLFSEALQTHSAPTHDREFVSLIADHLPSAHDCITRLKIQKINVPNGTSPKLAREYSAYFRSTVDLAWGMAEKAKNPFRTLREDLKSRDRAGLVHVRATVGVEMRAPVHAYVCAYEDRALFEKWETIRRDLSLKSNTGLWGGKWPEAVAEMVEMLHAFCDVLKEVCLRALKIYGAYKGFAFGISLE